MEEVNDSRPQCSVTDPGLNRTSNTIKLDVTPKTKINLLNLDVSEGQSCDQGGKGDGRSPREEPRTPVANHQDLIVHVPWSVYPVCVPVSMYV